MSLTARSASGRAQRGQYENVSRLTRLAASRCGTRRSSEALLDPAAHGFERRPKRGRVGASRLRHVGTPAALASDLQGDEVHELARLDPADEVLGHARDEA